jgi:tRNA threonylcarbamoyl adenosine modification protein (Sua5/YciO/YrdC/YwlC family)
MRVVRAVMIEGQAVLDAGAAEEAVAVLRRGGLLVYPTDTLYGLGADPFNADAMRRLLAAKRRPEGQPVSVVVADLAAAGGLAAIPPRAEALCSPWLPGAVTLLFRPGPKAPPSIVSVQNTVALRVPKHPVALMLAKRFGAITATSANVHGRPPPVECSEAQDQLGDAVDLYVDAGPCPIGKESTVVDLTGPEPRIIREGAISAARLGLDRRRP